MAEPYEPNTKDWKRGDIVIHHADAKDYYMLMRVVGIDHITGATVTEYIYRLTDLKDRHIRVDRYYRNDKKNLLDPKKFDKIEIGLLLNLEKQIAKEEV